MKAVLYVGHGSRVTKANDQLITFIQKVMPNIETEIQEICFLELAAPSIVEGIEKCVQRGAEEIAVIPVLLLAAGHAKVDIPRELNKAQLRFPYITFSYGRPLGISESIISVLGERLEEQGLELTNTTNRHDVTVLLVGRGSSDPEANSDLAKLGRLLWEYYPIKDVETCYLAATEPSYEEGLHKALRLEGKKVYVLPYLLFTGILMKKMQNTLTQYQNKCEKELVLCNYLGYHPKLADVVVQRVNEVL
ncbi:sirohydrochlorin chelatase [Anaerobacillus sp. MEB173]|uniref:sirohydrochlorin chelatase n=1 Tax=Anaerobacillus sp. MEB173 TaxID=3383345 RepID=UPI003F8F0DD8